MKMKTFFLFAMFMSLLLITQSARADFHKALDAYIHQDGEVMLNEVKDAVDKKNNDGLTLFLHAIRLDAATSAKSSLYEGFKGKRQIWTTLDTITDESQRQSLHNALLVSVNNSDIETQFLFAVTVQPILKKTSVDWTKLHNEYGQKGSYVAQQFSSDLIAKANAGDPLSQMSLGLKFLNFQDHAGYGCRTEENTPLCRNKNETKAYVMLKQALKTYESRGHGTFGLFADTMCELLHKTSNGKLEQIEQAYLWCVMGLNSGGNSSLRTVNEISATGLKKDFDIQNLTEFKTLPAWIRDARKELANEALPVFSYYSDDYLDYELEVYRDGKVKVGFGSVNKNYQGDDSDYISFLNMKKDTWLKVPPKVVKNFLFELKKTTAKWEMNNAISTGFCDTPDPSRCMPKHYQVTVREGANTRRLYFKGLVWQIAKLQGVNEETLTTKRIAKVSALVEKHFPTQSLRCGLGSSEAYKQACIERDSRWTNLAKEGN